MILAHIASTELEDKYCYSAFSNAVPKREAVYSKRPEILSFKLLNKGGGEQQKMSCFYPY